MIEITNKHIKNGKLDKDALAALGVDVVEFEGDKITFKTNVEFWRCDSLILLEGVTFNGNVEFRDCDSLASVDGAVFNSDVEFLFCDSLVSVSGATFNGKVIFNNCDSLASVFGATFKLGFKAYSCPNLKQEELK
jgi:hypothetical protein